jgi:hypothetical protein
VKIKILRVKCCSEEERSGVRVSSDEEWRGVRNDE